MSTTGPKPCPSCGLTPDPMYCKVDELWWTCCDCGMSSPTCLTEAGAIAQWNRIWVSGDPSPVHEGGTWTHHADGRARSVKIREQLEHFKFDEEYESEMAADIAEAFAKVAFGLVENLPESDELGMALGSLRVALSMAMQGEKRMRMN